MFSQASVILSTGRGTCAAKGGTSDEGVMCGAACVVRGGALHDKGGHAWQRGGMHGRGCTWLGRHVWQEGRPLQRTVCILLECILVLIS